MKIALICDVFGEANNGTVIATLNLLEYLRSRGHTVYVVSPDASTREMEDYYVVPTLNLGKFINHVVEKNGVTLAKADKDILTEVISKSDIVHLQMPFALSRSAVKIAKELNKPITASFHCQAENVTAHIGMMNSRLVNHLIYKSFYRSVYRYCTVVHYPTEFIMQVFYNHTHIGKLYYVISNGVNDAFFKARERSEKNDKFTIVCTGRYSKEKSQSILIRALAKSKHKGDIKVVFAGDGPRKEQLRRLAKRKGVECEFRFFSRGELVERLHNADLYVHTAGVEIESIACMEAIASGLVAIISNSKKSAARFFAVDERTKFRPKSAADLRLKVDYFYENRNALEEYKEKYKEVGVSFNQDDCMKKMEKMLVFATKINAYEKGDLLFGRNT